MIKVELTQEQWMWIVTFLNERAAHLQQTKYEETADEILSQLAEGMKAEREGAM